MATSDRARVVRMIIDEIWNQGTLDLADEFFASDLVRGPETIKISVALYRLAFPRLQIVVNDLFIEEDLAIIHWLACSTNVTEDTVNDALVGVTIGRFAGRQIAESWMYWDTRDTPLDLDLFVRPTDRHGAIQG
jgi:hypothetical protein